MVEGRNRAKYRLTTVSATSVRKANIFVLSGTRVRIVTLENS